MKYAKNYSLQKYPHTLKTLKFSPTFCNIIVRILDDKPSRTSIYLGNRGENDTNDRISFCRNAEMFKVLQRLYALILI